MKEKLPIKFFAKREEDKQRVEGGGKKELPKFVLSGSELNEKSAELSRMIFDALEEDWEDRNIPVIIEAKLNKDYKKSDEIRDEIIAKGYLIKDLPNEKYEITKA